MVTFTRIEQIQTPPILLVKSGQVGVLMQEPLGFGLFQPVW
ncbi:hypothetical protein ADICYQ_1449 [Cyclobacterium qasimii M12-11B]|uniref:Uncharacterized protein n=1 Tax=Cyclobacterium qasimii M12-11B TaxID=641524 RepID=S7WSF4_9BACT|nr:hypothetical protein ADICYQ_1449 [Cyclobacterium qasimii M12-11B]